jgi:hypothetical protein
MPTDEYRIILKRDADFWQDELTIKDTTSALVPLLGASLTIHPSANGDELLDEVVWDVDNGKLAIPSDGVIRFTVLLEEINAYEWTTGTYCLSITYTNGRRDRSFLSGPVEVADAC